MTKGSPKGSGAAPAPWQSVPPPGLLSGSPIDGQVSGLSDGAEAAARALVEDERAQKEKALREEADQARAYVVEVQQKLGEAQAENMQISGELEAVQAKLKDAESQIAQLSHVITRERNAREDAEAKFST